MAMKKALDQDNPKFDMFNAENRNEWVRVQSFSTFPTSSIDIFLLSLAHAGVYYTGIDAECRNGKWKDRDNPYIMHRKISPNCLYMNGRESGNVPVDETDRDRPRPFTYATPLTNVSEAGQEETVGVPVDLQLDLLVFGETLYLKCSINDSIANKTYTWSRRIGQSIPDAINYNSINTTNAAKFKIIDGGSTLGIENLNEKDITEYCYYWRSKTHTTYSNCTYILDHNNTVVDLQLDLLVFGETLYLKCSINDSIANKTYTWSRRIGQSIPDAINYNSINTTNAAKFKIFDGGSTLGIKNLNEKDITEYCYYWRSKTHTTYSNCTYILDHNNTVGIGKLSTADGKALTDPEVLRKLTSSVRCALEEAAQALHRMRAEQQGQIAGAEGCRSLAEACSDGDVPTVRKLLHEGGSVHETTEEGESLLSLAFSAGYYELAQVLLAMKPNVEDRGIKGDCTPLMEAASGGYVDIVKLLISHGADVNAQSSAGNTPLHYAACRGYEDVVQVLIEAGGNVEQHNENGHTPLLESASAGHVGVARILLNAVAGINTHSNEFKESALTLACYKGHLEMVKFLLEAGADQEHKTDEMHTALMEASMDGHVEVARLLLDSGAQVNMPADSFESPLTLAGCGGHVELASLLIEKGAYLEEVNDEGYTPLMEAAREGHEEMIALLLAHGADINAQTEETQETALTLACCGGFLDVADFLIKAGADNELGCSTPLMEATQEGYLEIIKYLLKAGSNVHAQTGTGDTALTYARENGHTDVAEVLLVHGAELEHESEGGRTPLMKAARAGYLCTVQFLISKGAGVNRARSTNDHTVLSLACALGLSAVVVLLLAHGADPIHKLKDCSTMIIEAAKGGHTQVVKLLLEYPNRVLMNGSPEIEQLPEPHLNEARVPMHGLGNIVPPNDPDSTNSANLITIPPVKHSEWLNLGEDVGITHYTQTGLTLHQGGIYSTRVGAGFVAAFETDGVVIDVTSPVIHWLHVGSLADNFEKIIDGYVWQADTTGIKAAWAADDHQSVRNIIDEHGSVYRMHQYHKELMECERLLNKVIMEMAERILGRMNYLKINIATQFDHAQKSLNRYRYGNVWGNVDKGNVQQLRFQLFQKIGRNRNSVLVEEIVHFLPSLKGNHFQILESDRNSVLVEEIVHLLPSLKGNPFQILESDRNSVLVEEIVHLLPSLKGNHFQILESDRNSVLVEEIVHFLQSLKGNPFQIKESNQNSVLDSEFSCYFEPMVNVKRHGSNEEYYNFDQEENKNQENIKRTDHDPKGEDSNMEDMFCEIETEKVGHLQETTEGHKFIESVSEVDHGKKLIDHSSNFDCEVGDIMEKSESEIDEINYERSTTNDVYSNEMIILTYLLHSTPVEGDHEFFDAMERSETEIDEINYERSTTNNVYSNEMIILTDLLHSTPVMFSNETINLKDLSRSTPVEGNHLSTKKSIHEETNVKRLVCNDTTCSLDENNLMRVELEDLEDLSVDEFNITQVDNLNDDALQGSHGHLCSEDNDIVSRNVFDYIRSIEIEEDGEPFCRNTKLEDDDEPFCRNTKSLSIDRYSNRVCSLLVYHMIHELNKDYQVIPELNKGDISNTSMKSDSEFASNSLKNGSDNGSLLSSCSCNVDAHVFNCQVVSPHSFVNDSNNDMQSSRTVIDLQKRQKSKSHARIVDSKKKPLLKEMINENVPTTENVCRIVRNIIETIKQKSISNLTKKSCRKCFSSYRKKPRRRLTRRILRRLIYPHRNISHVHVDIEARPLLNASERNTTTNGPGNGLNNVEAAALATSQRCLTTSLPSSSNSLNNYFSKLLSGYEFSTDEKMQFEMLRVQSFQDLPASCNVSPLRLARTGFFSSGSGDEVTCFSCGVKYKGWQNNDNPIDVHRRISSDCRMVNGRETRNIPVSQQHNGIIEHSGQQESLAHTTNDFAQSTVHFDGDVSTQTTEPTQNREMTREEVVKSNFSDNIQQSTNIKPPVDQPALDRTNPDQQYASSVPDQNRPAQSAQSAEDLGINLDKPKYPAYAQLNVRVSTFQGWPGYLDQTPRDMALAGFFYAGYNDYCRCFFCGGGLRNWDSGDDPWVEHTRWFPKCVFVQQNRGRRFVEIIVKRQAEMQASGNSVGNTKNQRAIKTQIGTGERSETSSQTSSQSADSNSTIDPAKASVRELGYADEIIDRAITIIKQNNPSKQKIEATDIMEVIFTITEDSETNTAVASENTPSSELNLPNRSQAVPQSNVSSQSNQPMSHSSQSSKPQVSKPNPQTAAASQSTNASENSLPSLSVSSLEHGNAAAVKSGSKEISENEIRSLQEENIQLKEQVMCKICMDKNVSIAFLPCGHLACCIDCAPAMRKCPMCRVYIKGTVKTFLA